MAKSLEEGVKAPLFTVLGDDDEKISLRAMKGAKVILYFYPKDDTPGCTKEAIAFTKAAAKFKRAGAVIVGISRDSAEKHRKFKEKHGLKIALGADEDGAVCEKYGVWVEKSMYGRKFMGIERSTFLIDEKGVVRRIWRKVRVNAHADDVLAAVKAL